MTEPVTGPYVKAEEFPSRFTNFGFKPIGKSSLRISYKQEAPFNKPLPFYYHCQMITSHKTDEPGLWSKGIDQGPAIAYLVDPANYNKAYENFRGKLGDTASSAVSIAERKQSMEMIAKRTLQVVKFVRALKNLRFNEAAKALGVTRPKIWKYDRLNLSKSAAARRAYKRGKQVWKRGDGLVLKRDSKTFANNFLEFHFGWQPLVNDIGSAVKVLSDRLPPFKVRGFATRTTKSTWYVDHAYYARTTYTQTVRQDITIRARASMDNPNLNLASRLGFTDPLGVLWEVVPFSFVADWFANVGTYLSAFTDFAGIKLIDSHWTNFTELDRTDVYRATYTFTPTVNKETKFKTIYCNRSVGAIPGPSLTFRSPWTLSPTRGLTAIALLIQSLK